MGRVAGKGGGNARPVVAGEFTKPEVACANRVLGAEYR